MQAERQIETLTAFTALLVDVVAERYGIEGVAVIADRVAQRATPLEREGLAVAMASLERQDLAEIIRNGEGASDGN